MPKSSRAAKILPAVVTALLLLACLLLPLLFVPGEPGSAVTDNQSMSPGEKAELYYRFTQDDDMYLTQLDESEVDNDSLIECTRIANTIENTLVMDEGGIRTDGPSGMAFYTLSGSEGTIRMMEYYHEWYGDWHNWFTLRIDLDTREIYYMYYSANVLQNGGEYAGRAEAHLENAGMDLIRELGFTDASLLDAGEASGSTEWELELTGAGGENYRYQTICNIYEDAAPSLLIDLRLTLTEITGT